MADRQLDRFLLREPLFQLVKEYMQIGLERPLAESEVEAFLLANKDLLGNIVAYDDVETQDRDLIFDRLESFRS